MKLIVGVSILLVFYATPASAQRASVWFDATGAHTRPPNASTAQASTYGLLGGRLRVDGRGSTSELAATGGRGTTAGSGAWLSARAMHDATRARGRFDYGLQIEAAGLSYLSAVDLGNDTEFTQSFGSLSAKPQVGVSLAGFRFGVEATAIGGAWRTQTQSVERDSRPLPLPREDRVVAVVHDGTTRVVGAGATVTRVLGAASMQLRAARYDAAGDLNDGSYEGLDATVGVALGAFDLSFGAKRWSTPFDDAETGGHAGIGVALGSSAYLQGVASRTVSDPVTGARGSLGLTIGLSMRVGSRSTAGVAPAVAGAATATGRLVTFTLDRAGATSVAVAGDFNQWEQAPMRRSGNVWTLELPLEHGAYHYAFVVDGETWMVPANATGIVDDGFGRKNATVVVQATNGRT